MRNDMVINQIISFYKPNKKNKKWKYDELAYFSNQTPYKFPNLCIKRINFRLKFQVNIYGGSPK
jgi:hypothetical protein